LTAKKILAAGVMSIPVCPINMAWAAFNTQGASSQPGYPCITVLEADCDLITYAGDSSCASPLVHDCQVMINNFMDSGSHAVDVGGPHQIANFGSCAFSVHGPASGASQYYVGLQDIIDIVQASIGNGSLYNPDLPSVIGAGGTMSCRASPSGREDVVWAIDYSTSETPPSC
jgi:hypothetical protein